MLKKQITFLVFILTLLLGFGIDLYAPAFPAIASALKASEQSVQLSISTYFFGYAFGMLLVGPISDAVGRKKPLLYGIAFYSVMSLACAFSPNIILFLALRFLQGLGVSAVGVLCRSIMGDVFKGNELAKAMTYYVMSYRLGPIVAPLLGGYLVVFFGWESNFYFLFAYAILLGFLVTLLLRETHTERDPFYPKLIWGRYWQLLKNPVFVGGAYCIGILYSLMIIFNVVGPFFLQEILGLSPIQYGHIAFLLGVAAFSGIMLNRFLLHAFTAEKVTRVGLYGVLATGLLQLIWVFFFPVNLWSFVVPVGVVFFMTGLTNSNLMSHIIQTAPGGKGVASALIGILIISLTGILTALSSFLKSDTARPFAIAFFILMLASFFSYQFLFKRDRSSPR